MAAETLHCPEESSSSKVATVSSLKAKISGNEFRTPSFEEPQTHANRTKTAVLAAFFHNPTYTVLNFSLLQQNPQQARGEGSGAYRLQGVEQNQEVSLFSATML